MRYVAASKPYTQHIDFIVNGELVTPTSATLTITRNDGSIVGSYDAATLTIPPSATSVDVTISGTDNGMTLPYEVRYIAVDFIYNGHVYYTTDVYQLRTQTNFPLDPQTIRNLLGVTESEIPDSAFDIIGSYQQVQADVPGVNLDLILEGGTALFPVLVNAVALRAAMDQGTTIQNNMFQMEQADNTLYRRFENIDFDELRNSLSARYYLLLRQLLGEDTSTGGVAPTLLSVVTGADPVTGE